MSECHVEFYHPWLPKTQGQQGQEFKGWAKCNALLLVEKVIFYQSISNDDKSWRASLLYYCLIQTNLATQVR